MNEGNTESHTGQQGTSAPCRSLEEAASEVDREIKVRQRCYDRWVKEGKLSLVDARDRLERMQSALAYLNRALSLEEAAADLPIQKPF